MSLFFRYISVSLLLAIIIFFGAPWYVVLSFVCIASLFLGTPLFFTITLFVYLSFSSHNIFFLAGLCALAHVFLTGILKRVSLELSPR